MSEPIGLDWVATDLVMRSALLGEDGGTVGTQNGALPVHGYYVGGLAPTLVFESREEVHYPEVREFIGSAGVDYIGFWVDSDDGRVHFDLVDWYESEFEASRRGRERKEIAIWDIRNERELRLAYVASE